MKLFGANLILCEEPNKSNHIKPDDQHGRKHRRYERLYPILGTTAIQASAASPLLATSPRAKLPQRAWCFVKKTLWFAANPE
jgi:hypothetical protein